MSTLYISGPINGNNQHIEQFEKAEKHYKSKGFDVINPVKLAKILDGSGEKIEEIRYMGFDLFHLSLSNAMVILPGYEQSKGCKHEILFANEYGIPIYHAYRDTRARINIKIMKEF